MIFRDFLEEQLKNTEIKKEYDALELRYTIVGGVNGVGKSTFLRTHTELCPCPDRIVDTDQITAELGGDPLTGGKAAIQRV